jgi:hypothetical protein
VFPNKANFPATESRDTVSIYIIYVYSSIRYVLVYSSIDYKNTGYMYIVLVCNYAKYSSIRYVLEYSSIGYMYVR